VLTRIAAIPGLDAAMAERVLSTLSLPLEGLGELHFDGDDFTRGLAELQEVRRTAIALGVPTDRLVVDLSIARGLDYYTGTVYETFLDSNPRLGSICSGGRYDDLAGLYTKSKLPGVGISIGITRLLSNLLESPAFAEGASTAKVIVLNADARYHAEALRLCSELRAAGIPTETYWEPDEVKKQLRYADQARIPLAILIGERDHAAGQVRIRLRPSAKGERLADLEVPRAGVLDELRRRLGDVTLPTVA
jgi:histidyl-tRNA synthetase